MTAEECLHKYFGYLEFRSVQKQVVDSILAGHDTLAVLPTGTGKSICFQVPGLILPGITIVITPLIALMKDQVEHLQQKRIRAEYLSSLQTKAEQVRILKKLKNNSVKFLYISPERLQQKKFRKNIKNVSTQLIVIDEAHCTTQWGDYFRKSYKEISSFINILPSRPTVVALTATATATVIDDIEKSLDLLHCQKVITTTIRNNLIIKIIPCNNYFYQIINLIKIIKKHSQECGIIYAATRESVEQLYSILKIMQLNSIGEIGFYHAGLDTLQRDEVQKKFIENKYTVLVATNAFGMGIDKPNIRYVVHFHLPGSLAAYYQEIGRAGRDNVDSYCYLLSNLENITIQESFINNIRNKIVKKNEKINMHKLIEFTQTKICRNKFLQRYFSHTTGHDCKDHCDNCIGRTITHDIDLQTSVSNILSLRLKLSREKKVEPALILTLQSITYIALLNPQTREEYLQIPGIGSGWIKMWYTYFINV